MQEIHLTSPSPKDAEDLLAFELENREFFETHINARPESYYSLNAVRKAIEDSIQQSAQDKSYQHLVRDSEGLLVGRVNLTRVRRAHFHSAELGYRIARSAGGKGYASMAVAQVVTRAFNGLRLVRIEASARLENAGSVRILTKNGFTQFGKSIRSFELDSTWYDLIHYERRADARPVVSSDQARVLSE